MPRLIITEGAAAGLERCRRFLLTKAPEAAHQAAQIIERHLLLLENTPEIGRKLRDRPELRELVIAFGDTGYVALYRFEQAADAVYILAVRHQREAGY